MEKIPVTRPLFSEDEITFISDAVQSNWVAQGPRVAEFEKQVAKHEGIKEGVATTSCTTALHLSMITHGMHAGMDVIAPSFTFVATVNSIVTTGATPILADVRKDTFCIDPDAVSRIIEHEYKNTTDGLVNKKTGNRLWGIVPVHQFGLCCDIYRINQIAKENGLQVIEDSACALGARIGDVHQGAFGNTSCLSFHPRKSITTGEGGMVLTNDEALAKRMRELRAHGSTISADMRDKTAGFLLPEFNEAGYNYRMTDIQGAMGLAQIKKLDYIIEEKRKGADRYNDLITNTVPELVTPIEPAGHFHTYQSYVCMLDMKKIHSNGIEEAGSYRNALLQKLEDAGVATRQGTHAVHMLGYYKNRFGFRHEDYPNAFECDRLSITLPLYADITEAEQVYVIETMRKTMDEMQGKQWQV